MNTAKLTIGDQELELPVIVGSEGEVGINVSSVRGKTKAITLDVGFGNTGSCQSAITFINGEKGVLRYRGYSIEDLAANSSFIEVSYLLIYGELPTASQFEQFEHDFKHHSLIHEDLKKLFENFPANAHPMSVLSAMVATLSTFYPESSEPEKVELNILRLFAKLSTITAFTHKKSAGQPFVYPKNSLSFPANFLHMMFAVPSEPYKISSTMERALDLLLILHAEHEQNCSTSTVRMVGSSGANLFTTVSAGISALSGPLHGGANQAVINMLEMIVEDGGDYNKYMAKAKDKNDPFRLMGFGHRVYKNFDPRAKIIKSAADDVLDELGVDDPLLDVAKHLERLALEDEYFVERKLYPNVDFYSGILYRAMGIPTDMFTVMFAMGRLPGWIAQWKEMKHDPATRIFRPRQIYIGPNLRPYTPITER